MVVSERATENLIERLREVEWTEYRFDQIAENINDRVDDPSEAGVDYYVGLEHLDPESLKIRRWGVPTDVEATKLRFKPGDIIFGRRRSYQRKLAVAEFEGICSAHAMVLRARENVVLPEFLPFFMQSETFFERALAISVGSLSPTINWKTLAAQKFALPPKDEQRRIAEVLWAADALLTRHMVVVMETEAIRQTVIDSLIDLTDHSVYPRAPLASLCQMQNGRVFPSEEYTSSGVKLLRPGNLSSSGYIDWSGPATTNLPLHYREQFAEYVVEAGDVVINLTAQSLEDGFVGRVCIARHGDESLLNQRIGRFYCGPQLLPEYLFRCLQTRTFRGVVESRCEGSKIRHLYWRHLEDFRIPVPPLPRQQDQVGAIALLDRALESAKKVLLSDRSMTVGVREHLLMSASPERRIANVQ